MKTRNLIICAAMVLIPIFSLAQNSVLDGTIHDANKKSPLLGVHVRLTAQSDTTRKYITSTDAAGFFQFLNVANGAYALEATYIGYTSLKRTIQMDGWVVHLGTLLISQSSIQMKEIVVEGRIPTAVQKGDTTEYNAGAFKMNRDATAEDLVAKMPGVTSDNTGVKAQGETVQQVLVDGRPFFGNDPTLALRNLPSEVIDKVQVFDKLSDQAQLTGFDDGQSVKTMNIITRQNRRQGQFGRFSGGYGTDDKYTGSGNLNSFEADQRISVLGLSDNVNQQNFSTQDLLGVSSGGGNQGGGFGGGMPGGGRRPASGSNAGRLGGGAFTGGGNSVNNFLVSQQNGVSTVNSLGLNYADSLFQNFNFTGSYFFNYTDNQNPQKLNRQYILSSDSSNYYNENSNAEQINYNHRFNFRVEYTIDSANSFIVTPQLFLQKNNSTNSVKGLTSSAENFLLSASENDNQVNTTGYTTQDHIIYRLKFPTRGRTLSVDMGYSGNRKQSDGLLSSTDAYYSVQSLTTDTLNQHNGLLTNGYTVSSNLVYTEPVGTNGLIQINYNPSYTKNRSDDRTYNFNSLADAYTDLNPQLSSTFDNDYMANTTGAGYRIRSQGFNAIAGVSYEIARLRDNQSYPLSRSLTKTFYDLLPNFMLNYQFVNRSSLRIFYRTSTTPPSITQLQSAVDNTNPLLLTTGNPDLKQSYSQTLLTRLTLSNTEKAQSMLVFFYANYTQDYIGSSVISAQGDSIIAGGIHLSPGTQLTTPVNLNGYWNVRSLFTFGFPFDLAKSNLNLNAGVSYTRTPGIVNSLWNAANLYTLSPGLVLGSNISEDIDFTLSYTGNLNTAHNTVQSVVNNNYYSHTAGLKFSWIFLDGIVLRNEVNNVLTNGLTGGLNQNSVIWNISLGKKFFADQRGELLVSVYDLLNQNKSVNRNVTDTYIEDTTSKVLNRYVMVTFTYNLRQFNETRSE
jgi:hypothetical protein